MVSVDSITLVSPELEPSKWEEDESGMDGRGGRSGSEKFQFQYSVIFVPKRRFRPSHVRRGAPPRHVFCSLMIAHTVQRLSSPHSLVDVFETT